MLIVGAGMAGCLAGVLNPTAKIIESNENFQINHDAVLRFRSDAISKQTGIPFKKVKVYKGIWGGERFLEPDIHIANHYSVKVTGGISDRSIWNVEPVERWVAPSNFHEMLEQMCNHRISYGVKLENSDLNGQDIISTIPMNRMLEIIEYENRPKEGFNFQKIEVNRYKVQNCDVHQTVYYPNPKSPHYRATLTGDDLIIESVSCLNILDFEDVCLSFAIIPSETIPIKEHHVQKYGKISPIDDIWRKKFMLWLTQNFSIYSLGRFATWRNILLDDVLNDIYQIRKMMNMEEYDKWKLS